MHQHDWKMAAAIWQVGIFLEKLVIFAYQLGPNQRTFRISGQKST
jgi:hypothetical protein